MADYFASLAARTLRPEPSVQPRQRVIWEDAVRPISDTFAATEETFVDGARPGASDETDPPRRSRRKLAAEPSPPESEPVERRPGKERSKRREAGDQDGTPASAASTPHPTVRALEPRVREHVERVAARPGDSSSQKPVVAGERATAAVRAGGLERARPVAARLSARERESAAEPAIRIHIGRVDVRAVTAAVPGPSPRASQDSTRALMSLDEYVQKRDRGVS